MYNSNIDKNRRKMQEKLGTNLAGPLEKYISQSLVLDLLKEIGAKFREAVFSPLGNVMGIYRPGYKPRSIV
jgi:hypothetical protein